MAYLDWNTFNKQYADPTITPDQRSKIADDYDKQLQDARAIYMDTSKPLEQRQEAYANMQGNTLADAQANNILTNPNYTGLEAENQKRSRLGLPAVDLAGVDPFEYQRVIGEASRESGIVDLTDMTKRAIQQEFDNKGQEGYNKIVAAFQQGGVPANILDNAMSGVKTSPDNPINSVTPGTGSGGITPSGSNTHGNLNLTEQTKARRRAIGDTTPTLLSLNQPKSLLGL